MSSGGASKEPKSGTSKGGASKGGEPNEPKVVIPQFLDAESHLLGRIRDLEQLWALYRSDPSDEARSRMCIALQELLKEHPFVRSETTVFEHEVHKFKKVGFTIDMWNFRKWLKTEEGKLYKKLTGTGVDDGVYLVSNLLRTYLPRGLHIITATKKDTGNETTFPFQGIPKFSGLTGDDEDEASSAEASKFFFSGSMADVKDVYVTEKSNGENAKLGMKRLDGILYLIGGSKLTCEIWPADRDYQEFYPPKEGERLEGEYPVQTICKIYSDWICGLSPVRLRALEAKFAEHGYMATIIAELNREWEQHIVSNDMTYLEFVSFLDGNGQSINPDDAFSFFESIGVTESDTDPVCHVRMEKFTINSREELDGIVNKIRDDDNSEGAVLYLFNKKGLLIGLVKVKTNWYITRRRLRELFRGFLTPLMGGVCKGIGHIQTRRKQNPDSKLWQTKKFSDLVTAVTKKIKIECGEFGQTFVSYMLKRLEDELGGQNVEECIADQQTIPFPAKDGACEMTSLMVAVEKLNMEFNTAFPQLVENCSA
jgi:hypothetical protein